MLNETHRALPRYKSSDFFSSLLDLKLKGQFAFGRSGEIAICQSVAVKNTIHRPPDGIIIETTVSP
jgi:hypothetical protein